MNTAHELDPQAAYALWAAHYPPHAHNAVMKAEERAMLLLLPESLHGLRVLDVGCGSGRYLLHAQQRNPTQLVGVDLSQEMLRTAQHHNLAVAQGRTHALPVATGWADGVLCGLTLGHVADLCAALHELARVTRPGGWLLCSDFHSIGSTLGWRREFKANGQRYAVQHWVHSIEDWQRACQDCGLVLTDVLEPFLAQQDIPPQAQFDPRALEVPVASVFKIKKT